METKKLTKLILIALGAWIVIGLLCGMRVHAAEASEASTEFTGQIKQLEAPASAHESADPSSASMMEFNTGDYIYVTDESAGWFQVYYRGDTMYVDSSIPMTDVDHTDEIIAEMTGIAATDNAWIDEYQMQVRAIKTSRRWRILIAVLIIAFIGVTIISTLTKKKPEP